MQNIDIVKADLIAQINKRLEDKIIEPTNAELLKKLILNAESTNEAMMIAELGTTYKRTGFHFDKRLEKMGTDIKYLKKNKTLSFENNSNSLTHKLIIGDNYDALQQLLITHRGIVDMIYIDPPYGKDSMGEFAKTNYQNAITRDNLLSMLYPRLLIAKQLLSTEGVIFCSIDDKNHSYVKGLFDEIFEPQNFIGNLIWRKKSGGGQTDEFFVTEHEYVLAYRKTSEFEWIDFVEDIDEKSFKYDDNNGKGKYCIAKLEKWGSAAHKEDRPTMHFPIKSPDGNDFYPIAPDEMPGRWRVGKERMQKLISNDEIYWIFDDVKGRYIPYEKIYLSTAKGKLNKSRSILYNLAENGKATKLLTSIFNVKDSFANPKPVELIKFLLEHVKSDVVLDFFAGSGTTGQAVLEQNAEDSGTRKFILCTNNEMTDTTPNGIAYDITSKRLKRVMTGECYDGSSDFEWIKKNEALGNALDVYEIESINNAEQGDGKSPFDVIDETCYDMPKFKSVQEKIAWVCNNFENTQKYIKEEE